MKAVAYFQNGIGNFVLAMPSLMALASMTESGKIDVCLNNGWVDYRRKEIEEILVAWRDVVNRVIDYPEDEFDIDEYDLYFWSPFGEKDNELSNIFMEKLRDIKLYRPNWRDMRVHETDYYMQIVRAQGFRGKTPVVRFPLADSPVLDLKRPIIGICNGYYRLTGYWSKKGWPYYEKLCEVMKLYFDGSVVAVGAEGEINENDYLSENYCGRLTILETAKVLSQLDLLVTNDTGLMHIANVLGVPMVALFGPTLVSKNKPRGEKSIVLMGNSECVGCYYTEKFETCEDNVCMKSISVGDVMAKAREILRDFI